MEEHISDFLVHVHETLTPEEQCEVEDFIVHQPGVVGVGFSPQHPHLMTIAYDADRETAHHILTHVREKVTGAEMVGL